MSSFPRVVFIFFNWFDQKRKFTFCKNKFLADMGIILTNDSVTDLEYMYVYKYIFDLKEISKNIYSVFS